MYDKTKYIYVGLDLHKEQHTAVIMDCFNEKLEEITFENKLSEFTKLTTKCKKYSHFSVCYYKVVLLGN